MASVLCCTVVAVLFACPFVLGRDSFIINGEEAEEGAWPWQGSLRFSSSDYHTCGCVFVHESHALTAGHCIGGPADNYKVVFGTNDHPLRSGRVEESRDLESIIVHPGYEGGCPPGNCYPNDIAILTFSEVIIPSDVIQPIAMDTGVDRTDQLCFITGFGDIEGGGPRPERLMEAEVSVLTDDECRYYLYNLDNLYTPEWHVCVFSPEGEGVEDPVGLCNGDSGGPMQCSPDGGESWDLVGLASWMIISSEGTPCLSSYASVYTRISTYREWVCANSDVAC